MGVRAGLEYPEGDPGGLSAAGGRLSRLASQVAGGAGSIARAGDVSGWEGHRYQVFQAAVRGLAPGLETAAGALRRAGRMVEDLAEQIQRAQRQIRGWAEEIEAAEQEARTAQAALTAERATGQLFSSPLAAFPGTDPVRDAQDRYDRASSHLAELRGRYEPKARRLCAELKRHDHSVAAALRAAAVAAPAQGVNPPTGPAVPAEVQLFAPVWMFTPSESYLPADPRRNLDYRELGSLSGDEWDRYLRGQGAGAPIFYRVRDYGDGEKVIEYWFYRRYNDFRDLHIPDVSAHPDDSEAVAVRVRDGQPVQVGYTQHAHGCSLPYADAPKDHGHPVSYPGDGSASNSPYRGHDDRIDGPFDDLHGAAPGESTPPDHVIHGEDQLVDYDGPQTGRPWLTLDPHERRVPGNESNSEKFEPDSPVWSQECEELPPRD